MVCYVKVDLDYLKTYYKLKETIKEKILKNAMLRKEKEWNHRNAQLKLKKAEK